MPTSPRQARRCAALGLGALVALLGGPARAEKAVDPAALAPALYQLDPAIDTAVALGGAALWTGAFFVVSPLQSNMSCDPCDPADLNALDRPFIRFHDPTWRPIGHAMYALPALAFIFLDIHDVGWRRWRIWMTDFTIIVEALVLQGVVTEVFRRSVDRPRPFLYVDGAYPEDRRTAEASFSFYSGHVSSVFALATGVAYTWTLRHPRSRWRVPVWLGTYLLAALSPIARVASGDHFPTDVLVGAAVGTAFGLGWPALRHHQLTRDRRIQQLQLMPAATQGGISISLGGRF